MAGYGSPRAKLPIVSEGLTDVLPHDLLKIAESEAKYALVRAVAVQAYSPYRITHDVDAVVLERVCGRSRGSWSRRATSRLRNRGSRRWSSSEGR